MVFDLRLLSDACHDAIKGQVSTPPPPMLPPQPAATSATRSAKRKAGNVADFGVSTKRAALRNISNEVRLHQEQPQQQQKQRVAAVAAKNTGCYAGKNNAVTIKSDVTIFTADQEEKDGAPESPADVRVNARLPPKRALPPGVEYDFDLENWEDLHGVPEYAQEIFEYLKSREASFQVEDYVEHQPDVSPARRSILVDWMVSVQMEFKMSHETLYRSVKLVDLYLMKTPITKNEIQLLGLACLFIIGKHNEIIPGNSDDYLFLSGNAYDRDQLFDMELKVLKAIDFDVGIPDSYTFLRRFAECAKATMPMLVLARYILEYSLMNYVTVSLSPSKMAAAALYLAMQMEGRRTWTTTMEYYSGYKVNDFRHIVFLLNDNLRKPFKNCEAVLNKYSRKQFLKVAYKPLINNSDIIF